MRWTGVKGAGTALMRDYTARRRTIYLAGTVLRQDLFDQFIRAVEFACVNVRPVERKVRSRFGKPFARPVVGVDGYLH